MIVSEGGVLLSIKMPAILNVQGRGLKCSMGMISNEDYVQIIC